MVRVTKAQAMRNRLLLLQFDNGDIRIFNANLLIEEDRFVDLLDDLAAARS